ncbi:MAG: 16S rRNA (cytosine(1402)-N(4))-methyltransferase, partial [Exilispira sp.]
ADETMSRQIAKAIVDYRKNRKIETNEELVKIISSVKKNKGKKNPATKVFQALRIKVNNEFENLKIALKKYLSLIERGGRIAVVSYHSGEDRIVKNFIKNNIQYIKILTKKPLTAGYEEVKINPSARSAKLRVFEKI